MLRLIRTSSAIPISNTIRCITTTSSSLLDQRWRHAQGLPENPNAYGPLTDMPDYTFLDGRPTPLGAHQKRRMLQQREIAKKIVTLSKELDFAKERYQKLQKAKEEERQKLLDSKLKPKGHLLLKK
uniref:Large ribosomal subunit protein mL52 n=1 Tax=Tabanus bromius TaxID=304241 RepID=A0A0K8TSB8_TABBR